MSRSGAKHPDAGEPCASTSREETEPHDAQRLYATLTEYLMMEHKFQPRLCLPAESENGEVTTGARDGAAHVLRSLKVWYDLPADVLINAINLFDRFLTKMKVRPCHVPCITVASMHLALDEHAAHTNTKRPVSVEELVSISQSACTAGDVCRMARVMCDKLGLAGGRAVTALHWLRLLRQLLRDCHLHCQESELVHMLEIAMCDATCANARTSELALVIVLHKLEEQVSLWQRAASEGGAPVPDSAYWLYDFATQLQAYCQMSEASLVSVRAEVRRALSQYEARRGQPQRQRLVWRLSERTLKVLRPTDRLTSLLPTIEEQLLTDPAPARNRTGSESSENEETSDWPRSPVLPVYCRN